ncbi:hypothetical protein [Streptomyces sp. NPDC059003]|uniref:hypothetical protein n=1 Tax=Streptomyces sp. NPDC059003 TaxID=3346691 RepID=UPI0036C128CD
MTGYVHTLEVDGRALYAKYSFLGMSLVSVVRGTCGTWEALKAAQAAYTSSPGSLLEREAAQLRLLAVAAVHVPLVDGYADGVLFTRPLEGITLGELILKEPHRTAELYSRALRELSDGLQQITARADRVQMTERRIPDIFGRKFNGISGRTYVEQAGDYSAVLLQVITRLRKIRYATTPGPQPLVYGDLKPEHVVIPNSLDGSLAFLDPGIARGREQTDTAKLVSRTVLRLIASPPPAADLSTIMAGLGAVVEHRTWHLSKAERAAWLRELAVLWLMDSVNILSTYLTCPVMLPMLPQADVAKQATAVCRFLDTASMLLETEDQATAIVWPLILAEAAKAATS